MLAIKGMIGFAPSDTASPAAYWRRYDLHLDLKLCNKP